MTGETQQPDAAPPRWDGRRILFEITDEDRSVACTISPGALHDLSQYRRFKPSELLKCFEERRPRIEAIALDKLRARPAGVAGLLHIWSDDVLDAAPEAAGKPTRPA